MHPQVVAELPLAIEHRCHRHIGQIDGAILAAVDQPSAPGAQIGERLPHGLIAAARGLLAGQYIVVAPLQFTAGVTRQLRKSRVAEDDARLRIRDRDGDRGLLDHFEKHTRR